MSNYSHFRRALCAMLLIGLLAVLSSPVCATDTRLTAHHPPQTDTDDLGYLLYTPADAQEELPLIVYLHGGSGKGSELSLLTQNDGFPRYLQEGQLGELSAYVLIPQLPADKKGWSTVSDELYALIDEIAAEYSIDRSNISLTGHSMGGTGTWSIAAEYPSLFARIAPLSGSIRSTVENRDALAQTSVWAFVGGKDTIVDPSSSTEMVQTLLAVGADARLTTFTDADHFSVPALTYLDTELGLLDWLIGDDGATSDETPTHLCEAYTDIPSNWAQQGICYVIEHGLMNGIGNGKFDPDSVLTRAQFVQILYNREGQPEPESLTPYFSDVKPGAWYFRAVQWAKENHITSGTTATTFEPETKVERQQLAQFLYSYAGRPSVSGVLNFPDANEVSWAVEPLLWATQNGLISGSAEKDGIYLRPRNTATRAQTASVLMHYFETIA